MFVYGKWVPVAAYDIQYRALDGDTGETQGGHWCGREVAFGAGIVTYCAVLPPKTASAAH